MYAHMKFKYFMKIRYYHINDIGLILNSGI